MGRGIFLIRARRIERRTVGVERSAAPMPECTLRLVGESMSSKIRPRTSTDTLKIRVDVDTLT